MSGCILVTTLASEFAREIDRLSDTRLPITACNTVDEALSAYSDQTVLFGSPGMIVQILDRMPTIDWVQSSWAGVTPLIDAPRRDYVLTGVKGVFGPQMAEYTLGHLLAHELRLHERLKAQREHRWLGVHSGTLTGKRLGVMGTGSIGAAIASAAAAFGMASLGFSRSGAPVDGFEKVYPAERLEAFLGDVDYLVSTLPATPDTANLLNADTLKLLPEHGYFINVGRSNVVDDDALVEALRTGALAGAALDVFDEEPVPEASALWDTPNLTMTAHVAAISHPLLIVPIFVENYRRYVAGESLQYVVDFDLGY